MIVAVLDLSEGAAKATSEGIIAAGGVSHAKTCDICDYQAVVDAVASVEEIGPIHTLVNNAGWDVPTPFLKTDQAFWHRVVSINYMGPIHVTHAVVSRMVARNQGRVIFIASDAGRVGSSGEVVYSGCKGATIAFAKALAREVARKNVLLNSVCPGPTNTPAMHAFAGTGEQGQKIRDALVKAVPLGRIGESTDYPGLVAFLASDDAAFITGQTISVSGGLTMHG
jgi:2-hydroxycyclohexanecarboxyl-CoA dehydrogenase